MVIMKTQIKKWGNSFGVIIPRNILQGEKLRENDEIEIIIVRSNNILKETFGILKGKIKKSTQQIMDETRRELYPEDYE